MSCEVSNKIGTGDCEQTIRCKSDPNLAKIIATELVAEIIENALDIVEECDSKKSSKVVGDLLETLTSKFEEMEAAVEENREESCLPLKGLGDQLTADTEEIVTTETTTCRHPPVEKKNRLTDLVKNSKHILAKFILSDNKEPMMAKNEEVIRVVELDSGDQPFKAKKKILPENVPLPRNDSQEILAEAECNKKETLEEIELFEPADKAAGGNGESVYKKTMTFPMAGRSGKTLSLAARCRTLKFPTELKKKKWNIGSKLINYIRKHHKKEDKEKETSGVEFLPKVDNE